ncbi:MAG TPA: ATP-binding protein [Nitrospirota bacterium]|nr:ATP-binding protein [Nitrospirota bacterium]
MQKKLIIALILYVVVISIGLGIVSTIAVQDVIERSLQKSLTSANTIANQLDFLLQTNISRLYDISLSGKVDFRERNWAPARRLIESIYQYSIFTEGVFLLDKHGNTLMSYPARDYNRENLLFIPWVSRVLSEGRPIISNVYTIEPIKKPLIFVLVPLRNTSGDIVGAAGGAINPTNSVMSRILRGVKADTGNYYLEIIDSNEVVVASDKNSRILTHHDHDGSLGKMIKDGASGIRNCGHGFSHDTPDNKTQDMLAIVPLQSVSWAVVFGQAKDEIYLPAQHLKYHFLLIALIFIGTALIFSLGISRNIVSPIRSLISAAYRIGQGNLNEPVGNVGSDEIAALGRSVDAMRERLAKSLESIQRYNAELEERVLHRTRELEEKQQANASLLKKLITSQEDERKRIARELHDESLQTLSAILMNIEMCRLHPDLINVDRVTIIRDTVSRVINEMQKVVQNLRPTVLDDLGFEAAVVWLVDNNLRNKGIHCHLNIFELAEEQLGPELQITLFRVIQEMTTNIARHAGARNASLYMKTDNQTFTLLIEDDGSGFDTKTVFGSLQSGRGLGLLGMRERVAQVNGSLDICSAPGEGTIVRCTVPISQENAYGDKNTDRNS